MNTNHLNLKLIMFDLSFDELGKQFSGLFGKLEPGFCRLTLNGDIAIKTTKGYRRYDLKTQDLVNVTHFTPTFGEGMFFIIPTSSVEVGDIILDQNEGRPVCVVEVSPNSKRIKVIDYEHAQEKVILPEKHVLWGSAFYYGRITSMFGSLVKTGGMKGMMESMMRFSMLNQMFGGDKSPIGGGNNFMGMMFMSSALTGNNGGIFGGDNPFGKMFDGMFSAFGEPIKEDNDNNNKTEE